MAVVMILIVTIANDVHIEQIQFANMQACLEARTAILNGAALGNKTIVCAERGP